jgi:anti-anti-sigma regulatory factor
MLKITEQHSAEQESLSPLLEGRLTGPWVDELRRLSREISKARRQCTMIDLAGVTFIDADGKLLLAQLSRQGVELRAAGCMTGCVVKEITRGGRPHPVIKTRGESSVKGEAR